MEEYDRVSRCKCNFKRNKTKCVRVRPDPDAQTAPFKRVKKRCTCGFRYNKPTDECIPSVIPKQVNVLHPLIEIERVGKHCPPTFNYNYKTKKCIKCPDGTRKYRNRCILIPTDDVVVQPKVQSVKIPDKVDDVVVQPKVPEKVEVVLPVPDLQEAAPAPYTLAEYVNAIEDAGKKIGDAKYRSGRYLIFVYIYLIRKYATECSIFRDAFHLSHTSVINYNIRTNEVDHASNLGHQMQQCILRGSELIFLTLWVYNDDPKHKSSHVNILIYRPFKKTIERYEPHGDETSIKNFNEYDLNIKLKQLFEEKVKDKLREYTPKYRTPYEICPNKHGFQGIENQLPSSAKESGYCQMWIMFMMETTLLNPTLNTVDIINRCFEIGKKNPQYFLNLIRGYSSQMAKEIQHFLGPDFDITSGSDEAHKKFKEMDVQKLIAETNAETNKRHKKLQPINEDTGNYTLTTADITDIDRKVKSLNLNYVAFYVRYLYHETNLIQRIDYTTTIKHARLKNSLLQRNIPWEMLMERIYNSFFIVQVDNATLNKCKYFLKFGECPKPYIQIHLKLPINRIEIMKQTKSKYALFHKFWKPFFDSDQMANFTKPFTPAIQATVHTAVKELTVPNLNKCISLMIYYLPTVPADKKEQFDAMSKKDKQNRLYLLLIHNNLTTINVLNWAAMFE